MAASNVFGDFLFSTAPFLYADLWTDPGTWPGLAVPRENEDVLIPAGQRVLVDLASTPVYGVVTVEGALFFSEAHDITFSARQIVVRKGGLLQAGTPQRPRQSRLKIVLHGRKGDAESGALGSKNIVVLDGRLSLAGQRHMKTWVRLGSTASAGSSELTLSEPVNWAVGD